MKKLIIASLITLTSAASFAVTKAETKQAVFKHRAMKVLNENAEHLIMFGDVGNTENLADILATTRNASSVSQACKITDIISANCTIYIQHQPVGETVVKYKLRLDRNQMPQRIMEAVEIVRGD